MQAFVRGLKTSGRRMGHRPLNGSDLYDLKGHSIVGKSLSEFSFLTDSERSDIEYCKSEAKRQKLQDKYNTIAAEKTLNRIRMYIMTGGIFPNDTPGKELRFLADYLADEFGVSLKQTQFSSLRSYL